MNQTLDQFLRTECEALAEDTEDYDDARQYLGDVVSDAADEFPDIDREEIEEQALQILKETYGRS